MPICTREGFDNVRKRKEEYFKDNDYVFYCEITKQMFRDYEEYFKHVMAINSTVWQCELTGRENLTYAEALKSEKKARMKIEFFKDSLRPPVMLVIDHAKQSSLNNLNTIVAKFLRRRFFLNEEVTACPNSSNYFPYKVLEIIPPDKSPVNKNIVYDATEQLLYRLKRINQRDQDEEIILPFERIRRPRHEFTSENLAMFIKDNIIRVDGILRPKPGAFKKYITDRNITFEKLFIGRMPHYTPSRIKSHSKANDANGKRQLSINKYLVKNDETNDGKQSDLCAHEEAKKAKEKIDKVENAEARAEFLKEEMERVRREKQERLLDMERQRAEKREKLLEKVDRECTKLLTKTDDLERTDQRLLPRYKTIRTYIPNKYFGDALMVNEFMHSFAGILSGIEVFRNKLSFYELSRAFTTREVAGPLSDIILILLGTIFDLQKEEEDKYGVTYLKLRLDQRRQEPQATMALASKTHFYARRHFSLNINQLPLDAQTVSEVLRLHLLSAGACVNERTDKWRIMNRNGYTSSEDPGLSLRFENPNIIRLLRVFTIYQLPFLDIISVIHCLISQILTYSIPLALIEERMEQTSKARIELRALSILESKRLAKVEMEKKAMTCEYQQQCMDIDIKDLEKRKQAEEKFNKKINELLAQSKRKQKEYETEVEKLNNSLFDYLIYLGTDRAYRKYYAFESLPGVFVEHIPECLDKCLENPPTNDLDPKFMEKLSTLPKNRKDLRAYLLRLYTKEDKELAARNKSIKNKNNTQENKENLENLATRPSKEDSISSIPLINGNVVDKPDINGEEGSTITPVQPSQYELYMCTGDPKNCMVHDPNNPDRQLWAYLYEKSDIDDLIAALNPLGDRESQLLKQLQSLRQLIISHAKKCPADKLTLDGDEKFNKFKNTMFSETYRKYGQANLGFPKNADLNEVMYGTLVTRILQFESDIYTGDLGHLKVKDMDKWRRDVQDNTYDPQGKLHWGPNNQKLMTAITDREERDVGNSGAEDAEPDDDDTEGRESGKYIAYEDPGEELGDSLELSFIDNSDQGAFLHQSDTLRQCVKNLSSALLQIEQGIERRFLKEPFGVSNKDMEDKELLERKMKISAERLKKWEVSLMESSSYSQVFLHYNILHDSIIWARSTNKSLCQVCRRGSEPDKMLLCDECNGGTHTFCMKPKMKTVPEGNWYCRRCVTRLGLTNEKVKEEVETKTQTSRRRAFLTNGDDHVSETSSLSSMSEVRMTRNKRFEKRLKTREIEELVVDEEEAEEENEVNEEEMDYEDEETMQEDDILDEDNDENVMGEINGNGFHFVEVTEEEQSEPKGDDDAELVCRVCCYDGSDVTCTRCQDSFHLECIELKRPPRYNFTCNKCKVKDEKNRRKRTVESSSDDNTDGEEYARKRSRRIRTSFRNTVPNGTHTEESPKSSSGRRSNRRTADDLPLNGPVLYDLLDDIMKHKYAWPFLRPVLQSEVPDYYKIIKKPMDFAKIKSKLNMGDYQLNEELLMDIRLIFQNCDTYNVEGNEIYNMGSALEKIVMERCKELNLPYKPSEMNAY